MKISIIGPTYPYKGGISHFTTVLSEYLHKKNRINFISWKRQYPAFLYPVELRDKVSEHPIETQAKYILDFFNPITWIEGFLDVKRNKSDLLILAWVSPVQSPIYFFISFLVKSFTKTEVMYICHNVLPHEQAFYDKILAKLAFSHADSFIVHAEEDKKILESLVKNKKIILGFLPLFNMFCEYEAEDIERFKKEMNLEEKVLIFFGYIRPYKGLKYLIKAMPKILKKYPKIKLIVVGEFWSKDRQSYIDLVDNLKLTKNVIFFDHYIPNEEVGKYFAVSDVCVLPYTSATQSAIIQTAYALNKPVISTKVGGLKDVIIEGKTGYSIKSENVEDIVEKVFLFYKKPISSKDIELRKQKWSWDKYVELIQK